MGYFEGMGEIGLARKTDLSLMDLGRVDIGLLHQADIRLRMVGKKL
jgi:hypothetical protein